MSNQNHVWDELVLFLFSGLGGLPPMDTVDISAALRVSETDIATALHRARERRRGQLRVA